MSLAICRDLAWRHQLPQLPHLRSSKRGRFLARSIANDDDATPKRPLSTLDAYFDKLQGGASQSPNPAPPHQSPAPQQGSVSKQQSQDAAAADEEDFDEYALKEELLFSVLREVEAAERAPFAGPPPNAAAGNANAKPSSKQQTPMLVINPRAASPGAPPQGDGEPVIVVQLGSLLVPLLVTVNVGVFIFDLATSHGEGGAAFLHGAKANDLILSGEWWRLITPVFLHSGVPHICLSTWALLSFGGQVEALYGSVGFLLLYFLGGGVGNLASFLETPGLATVGGTGPVFAIVCSWFAFVLKNRAAIKAYDTSELVQKSVVLASLSLLLGNQLPIDSWTHLGGALVGLLFGVVASPWYQPTDRSAAAAVPKRDKTGKLATDGDLPADQNLERSLYPVLLLCCGALACLLFYVAAQENFGDVDKVVNQLLD